MSADRITLTDGQTIQNKEITSKQYNKYWLKSTTSNFQNLAMVSVKD